jgi:hypothetical protein
MGDGIIRLPNEDLLQMRFRLRVAFEIEQRLARREVRARIFGVLGKPFSGRVQNPIPLAAGGETRHQDGVVLNVISLEAHTTGIIRSSNKCVKWLSTNGHF